MFNSGFTKVYQKQQTVKKYTTVTPKCFLEGRQEKPVVFSPLGQFFIWFVSLFCCRFVYSSWFSVHNCSFPWRRAMVACQFQKGWRRLELGQSKTGSCHPASKPYQSIWKQTDRLRCIHTWTLGPDRWLTVHENWIEWTLHCLLFKTFFHRRKLIKL